MDRNLDDGFETKATKGFFKWLDKHPNSQIQGYFDYQMLYFHKLLDDSPKERAWKLYFDAVCEKNDDKKIELLKEASKLDPNNLDVQISLIIGASKSAEDEVTQLESLEFREKERLKKIGLLPEYKTFYGLTKEAEAYLRIVYHISDAYRDLRLFNKEQEWLEYYLDCNCDDRYRLRQRLAKIYISKGDDEKLENLYYSRDGWRGYAPSIVDWALMYVKKGDFKKAYELSKRLERLSPSLYSWFLFGNVYQADKAKDMDRHLCDPGSAEEGRAYMADTYDLIGFLPMEEFWKYSISRFLKGTHIEHPEMILIFMIYSLMINVGDSTEMKCKANIVSDAIKGNKIDGVSKNMIMILKNVRLDTSIEEREKAFDNLVKRRFLVPFNDEIYMGVRGMALAEFVMKEFIFNDKK